MGPASYWELLFKVNLLISPASKHSGTPTFSNICLFSNKKFLHLLHIWFSKILSFFDKFTLTSKSTSAHRKTFRVFHTLCTASWNPRIHAIQTTSNLTKPLPVPPNLWKPSLLPVGPTSIDIKAEKNVPLKLECLTNIYHKYEMGNPIGQIAKGNQYFLKCFIIQHGFPTL